MKCRETQLGFHVDLISGPAFPSNQFTDDDSDVPLVKGENIGQGTILWDKSKYWPQGDASDYERFRLKAGDVVLAMDRPWVSSGLKYAVINEKDPEALLVQRVARIRGINGLSSRYLRYVVASPGFCSYVKGIQGGTNVPHISGDQIRAFRFRMPRISEQERIACILSAYDDLIENDRRRIQLLEQSARLLYKEWFVRLRFPGHEHVKIKDGVPDGWQTKRLIDCVTFQSGGTPSKSKSEYWAGDIPWMSSGELTSMRLRTTKHHVTEEAVLNGSRFAEVGTILGVVRGMSLAKEFRLGVVAKRMCFNQDVKAFVPDRGIESLYVFHALDEQRERVRQQAGEASHGTKKLETAVMENLSVKVPKDTIRKLFTENASALHAQMDILLQQTRRLEQARDLLLPRLMSGELTV